MAGQLPSATASQKSSVDLTLDLLEPFVNVSSTNNATAGPSRWSAAQATSVKERLEQAITENKRKTHSLLLSNFGSISSHIQLSESLQDQHGRIVSRLSTLEAEIDPTDTATSFLPPVIATLNKHFTASNRRARAEAHVRALKALEKQAAYVGRLEEAIWGGRGADDWVVEALTVAMGKVNGDEKGGGDFDMGNGDGIEGTRVAVAIQTRTQLYKSMLLEQLSEAFSQAISISFSKGVKDGAVLRVQSRIQLQQPKVPRPENRATHPSSSSSETYTLPHLQSTLSSLSTLTPLLSSLSTRLIRDLVKPLSNSTSTLRLNKSADEDASQLLLSPSSPKSLTTPGEKIADIRLFFPYMSSTVFPPLPETSATPLIQARNSFLSNVTSATLDLLLEMLIIAMPPNLADVPCWLGLLESASNLEASLDVTSDQTPAEKSTVPNRSVIRKFADEKAGNEWVKSRAKTAMEEVKYLVRDGWAGWDAMEVTRQREVVVLVEEELEDAVVVDDAGSSAGVSRGRSNGGGVAEVADGADLDMEEDGWGLDSPITTTHPNPSLERPAVPPAETEGEGEEDAWGFGDNDEPTNNPTLPASSAIPPQLAPAENDDEPDGWDFDMTAPIAPSAPASSLIGAAPIKPVREAKKLGKRAAKAKALAKEDGEDDVMDGEPRSDTVAVSGVDEEGWGWDEPASSDNPAKISQASLAAARTPNLKKPLSISTPVSMKPARRTVTREERRVITETYLVSKACEKLIGLVERCLTESKEMEQSTLPASFIAPHHHLRQTAISLLDAFRALIPLSTTQIKDVLTLSLQLSNDLYYLSTKLTSDPQRATSSPAPTSTIPSLGDKYNLHRVSTSDTSRRLLAASEHIFESTLRVQKDGLMGILDDAHGWEGTGMATGGKRCEGVMRGLSERLESLGRVTKVVLPPSSYYPMMGYLIDTVVSRISAEVLTLADITEVESERLEELLRILQPLEEIFEGAEPPTSIIAHVPHWLKYQYISELLRANLVDITYLFDTGALVDFTQEELVNVVRALFADSEKRDRAIERIESGRDIEGQAGNGMN